MCRGRTGGREERGFTLELPVGWELSSVSQLMEHCSVYLASSPATSAITFSFLHL